MSWSASIITGIITGIFVLVAGTIWATGGLLPYMIFGAVGGFIGANVGQYYDSWKNE